MGSALASPKHALRDHRIPGDPDDLMIGGIGTSRLATDGEIRLPKVSFIVRNWNYGRFIGRTIDSIRAQDYPNFEVIIVDNASTDDSRAVIKLHVDDDPRFRIIHSDINLGPLGGALRGLEHAGGDFVAIIDSDDTLMSNFASVHIQVHLASRHNVPFTSSSTIETGPDGAMLNGRRTRTELAHLAFEGGLRPAEIVPRLRSINDETYAILSRHTRMLPPVALGWPWSPGTSNMYRRFILNLIAPNCDPVDLPKLAADGHYNRLAHLLGGSAVIDIPLSTYRIHGNNFAASTPSLTDLGGDSGPATNFHGIRAREMIRVFVANAAEFSTRIGEKRYWTSLGALFDLSDLQHSTHLNDWNRKSFLGEQIRLLGAAFGEEKAIRKLAEILPGKLLRSGVRACYGPKQPSHVRLELLFCPVRRLHARIKRLIQKRRQWKSSSVH
jgi:hypothetical protein